MQDSVQEAELVAVTMPGRRWSHHVTDITQYDYDELGVDSVKRAIFCWQILMGIDSSISSDRKCQPCYLPRTRTTYTSQVRV